MAADSADSTREAEDESPGSPTPTTPRLALNGVWLEQPLEDPEQDDEGEADVKLTPYVKRVVLVAALGSALFGFDTASISTVLVTVADDLGGALLTTGQEELAVSAATLGALFGALLASQLADRIGRKKTLLAGSIFFALGAIEQSAAQIYKELVLGRAMVGIGVGLASMVLPVYSAELSPARYRGQIVTLLVVMITFGQLVAYVLGALLAQVTNGWRWLVAAGAIPAFIQLALSIALPESPRYLIQKDRLHEAHRILQRIYPHLDSAAIERKVSSIERILVAEQEAVVRIRLTDVTGSPMGKHSRSMVDALWHDAPNRRALILACGLQFFQQATGFNTLMYYSGKILRAAGFARPASAAIFIALSNFICTLISLRYIDRVGRRRMLLRTMLGMVAGLFLTGFCFIFVRLPPAGEQDVSSGGAAAVFALLFMIVFCASYGLGLGNVPWIVQSEIFAYEVRSLGNSFATGTNWLANLVVAATFLHLTQLLTATGAFWLYAVVTCAAWVFAWRLLPETSGLSIEQCRQLFESKTPGLTRAPQDPVNGYRHVETDEEQHVQDADAH